MPTVAEEAAFLSPILASPKDDGPRLILADFLDESDDPADVGRAEFIRLQLALAKLPADHPRRRELQHRHDELQQRFLADWTRHMGGLATGFTYRRGILDAVSVDVPTFLARGDDLFRRAPVRGVKFLDAARHVAALAGCEHLSRVRDLGLCGADLGNGGLNVLLRSPHLTRVESLDLSFNGLCDRGVALLARTNALPRLTALHLNDNGRIAADGLTQIAESPALAQLRVLDVSANDVSGAGLAAVARSRTLTRLHTFRFHSNHVGDAGAEALADSPLLARMLARDPRLLMPGNGVGPAGVKALAKSPLMANVRELDLTANALGDEGVEALAASEHFTKLRRLILMQNRIGNPGAVALAASPLMGRLDHLDVSSNRITRLGVDALWRRRKDFHTVVEYGDNLVTAEVDAVLREVLEADPLLALQEWLARRQA